MGVTLPVVIPCCSSFHMTSRWYFIPIMLTCKSFFLPIMFTCNYFIFISHSVTPD